MAKTVKFKALGLEYSEAFIPAEWNEDGQVIVWDISYVISKDYKIVLHTEDYMEMLRFLERELVNLQGIAWENGPDAIGAEKAGELASDNIKFMRLVQEYL